MTRAVVPVTHNGVTIGTAMVDDDGIIEAVIDPQSELLREMMEVLRVGLCDGLSISPNLVPVMPATPEPRPFIVGQLMSVRIDDENVPTHPFLD